MNTKIKLTVELRDPEEGLPLCQRESRASFDMDKLNCEFLSELEGSLSEGDYSLANALALFQGLDVNSLTNSDKELVEESVTSLKQRLKSSILDTAYELLDQGPGRSYLHYLGVEVESV